MQSNGDVLQKSFTFTNFNEAFGFMTRIALEAERLDHHPNWQNVYNQVDISLSTHVCGSISQLDVRLAHFIDKCQAETKKE